MRGSAPTVHLAPQQFERGRLEANEFDPYSYTRQRITNFSANAQRSTRQRQAKSHVENCALWKTARGVDEHTARADIWRTDKREIGASFVDGDDSRHGVHSLRATRRPGKPIFGFFRHSMN